MRSGCGQILGALWRAASLHLQLAFKEEEEPALSPARYLLVDQ